jgi:hypothetical protein
VIACLALATRIVYGVRHGGPVFAHGYDSGVYYAAADALVHGRVPYRDFLFIESPGITVVVAPFAFLGSITHDWIGYGTANVFFTAIGAASSGMVAVVLRRFGLPAAILGGVFYAVTDSAVASEQFIKLEPVATLLILIALALLGDVYSPTRTRRTLVAGLLLGFACGFKIWYIVPAVVVLASLPGARRRLRLLIGGVCGATAIMLPFFVAAPGAMFREVVLDQLGRGRAGISLIGRLHDMLGEPAVPHTVTRLVGLTVGEITGGLAVLAAIGVILAVQKRSARLYVWLLLSGVFVLLAAPSFFPYYTSLTTAPLALVLGVAFARLASLLSTRRNRLALTASALAGLAMLNLPGQWHASGDTHPSLGMRRAVEAVPGCVVSDDPEILATTGVLSRDLEAGCVVWPDVTGWTYDADNGMHDGIYTPRVENRAWQQRITAYLTSGDAVIPYRSETGLDAHSKAVVTAGPALFRDGKWVLYATPNRGQP